VLSHPGTVFAQRLAVDGKAAGNGREALFPTFFMGGFECSSHVDRSHRRQDYVQLTQHDRFVREDYERVRSIGLGAVRDGPRWYVVINELSTLAWAIGEAAWFAPFYKDKAEAIKEALVVAALRATDAVRAVDAEAHFLSVDPTLHLVTPYGREDLAREVERQNRAQYEAWDMALGRVNPELGGASDAVEVIGINCYQDS
jgi:hypothetical protein